MPPPGSSPRMRGTPMSVNSRRCNMPDHPRACGELETMMWKFINSKRIIPAHAGNSRRGRLAWRVRTDHPRACGELADRFNRIELWIGSSPRMRGTRIVIPAANEWLRIIPAHAGNSKSDRQAGRPESDHPRACGELDNRSGEFSTWDLDHPRACGELRYTVDVDEDILRIIPAHAGNSSTVPYGLAAKSDHPRACGELDSYHAGRKEYHWIIPAHAGNSVPLILLMMSLYGSSPRMRGTLRRDSAL